MIPTTLNLVVLPSTLATLSSVRLMAHGLLPLLVSLPQSAVQLDLLAPTLATAVRTVMMSPFGTLLTSLLAVCDLTEDSICH